MGDRKKRIERQRRKLLQRNAKMECRCVQGHCGENKRTLLLGHPLPTLGALLSHFTLFNLNKLSDFTH
jgi:hypothetical protein